MPRRAGKVPDPPARADPARSTCGDKLSGCPRFRDPLPEPAPFGQSAAGLAEVETNAKISFYEVNGIHQISSIAGKFSLSQNYPNPFNPTTKIKYSIPQSSAMHMMSVQLKVYDITGRLVSTPINEFESPGTYEVDFNASNIASGVYFYRLTAGNDFIDVKKMIVLK